MNNYYKGFTLIELMIALVLGLLLSAAALTLYLTAQRSLSLQDGMGELQQNGIFGLGQLTYDLRHVNLNTPSTQIINTEIVGSGIIFNHNNLPSSLSGVDSKLFSSFETQEGATNKNSDQLTIQYIPQFIVNSSEQKEKNDKGEEVLVNINKKSSVQYDCEGNKLEFSEKSDQYEKDANKLSAPEVADRVIVQRYYISEIKDSQSKSFSPKRYALFCDAGYYKENDTVITGLGSGAQQIIQDVEAFKFLLGVRQKSNGYLSYQTLKEYLELTSNTDVEKDEEEKDKEENNIVSINLALLMRSANPIGPNKEINNDKKFIMFGEQLESDDTENSNYIVELKDEQKSNSKYLRQVISQVVAFRNTLGGTQ